MNLKQLDAKLSKLETDVEKQEKLKQSAIAKYDSQINQIRNQIKSLRSFKKEIEEIEKRKQEKLKELELAVKGTVNNKEATPLQGE